MKFKPGKSGNPRGRPKAKISTADLKEIIDGYLPRLPADLGRMRPAVRWTVLSRLMKYTYPALQAVAVDLNRLLPADEAELDKRIKSLLQLAGYEK